VRWDHLVEGADRIEGARIADERQQLGQDGDWPWAVVADIEVGGDVAFDLGVAAAEGDEDGKGEQPAGDRT
jgi:hypothetical protein